MATDLTVAIPFFVQSYQVAGLLACAVASTQPRKAATMRARDIVKNSELGERRASFKQWIRDCARCGKERQGSTVLQIITIVTEPRY